MAGYSIVAPFINSSIHVIEFSTRVHSRDFNLAIFFSTNKIFSISYSPRSCIKTSVSISRDRDDTKPLEQHTEQIAEQPLFV